MLLSSQDHSLRNTATHLMHRSLFTISTSTQERKCDLMLSRYDSHVVNVHLINRLSADEKINIHPCLQHQIHSFENGCITGMFRIVISSPDEKEIPENSKRFYIVYELSFSAASSDKDADISDLISDTAPIAYSEIRAGIDAMIGLSGMARIALPCSFDQFV